MVSSPSLLQTRGLGAALKALLTAPSPALQVLISRSGAAGE